MKLKRILEGREAKARVQRWLLGKVDLVAQVSLNIPGFPKDVKGSRILVDKVAATFTERVFRAGGIAPIEVTLENGVGVSAFLGISFLDAIEAKEIAVALEEAQEWGRILDIDILTQAGALTREKINKPPRKCLLCERDAKWCASTQVHKIKDLRKKAIDLVQEAVGAISGSLD